MIGCILGECVVVVVVVVAAAAAVLLLLLLLLVLEDCLLGTSVSKMIFLNAINISQSIYQSIEIPINP